jgi:DUF4097 and DUF4098 domain-containing protein YvlB
MSRANLLRFSALAVLTIAVSATATPARAQEPGWQKSYPVTGRPTLNLATSDAGLEIHSCGDCKEIRIAVEMRNRKLSDFNLTESQSGDSVTFRLKEKEHLGMHVSRRDSSVHVSVETPAELTLDAETADGNVGVHSLKGDLRLHSGDGSLDLHDVEGTLHVTSSDGNLTIHNATGTLEGRTSDGRIEVDGRFSQVQLHTSDGNLDFALAEGSRLTAPSRIESSDGRVTVRVPKGFAADLDVHTSDGRIECALPVTTENFNSGAGDGHRLHGRLNGGGTALTISSSDGNVTIASL